MRFVLLVEGQTERQSAASFLKRWLDPRLSQPVGIQTVAFRGFADLVRNFAVHEFEAWLLSQPEIFPTRIRSALPNGIAHPERINSTHPPSKLLTQVYRQVLGQDYKKTVYGRQLFDKLDPEVATGKCPDLRAMLDEMLKLAKCAGL